MVGLNLRVASTRMPQRARRSSFGDRHCTATCRRRHGATPFLFADDDRLATAILEFSRESYKEAEA